MAPRESKGNAYTNFGRQTKSITVFLKVAYRTIEIACDISHAQKTLTATLTCLNKEYRSLVTPPCSAYRIREMLIRAKGYPSASNNGKYY